MPLQIKYGYSIVQYSSNGSQTQYVVPFPFLQRVDVLVSVYDLTGVSVTASFGWINDGLIYFPSAYPVGYNIVIERRSSTYGQQVDFTDTATVTERDLDLAYRQAWYTAQEAMDVAGMILLTTDDLEGDVAAAGASATAAAASATAAAASAGSAAASATAAAASAVDSATSAATAATHAASAATAASGAVNGKMDKASNLSDVTNVVTSRANLGLGTMAVATAADYLDKAGNLVSLASPSAARTNLGLGTMAVAAAADYLDKAGNLAGIASASAARTNLGITPFAGLHNLIIGGEFSTNPWQRGITFIAPAHNTFTADMWRYINNTGVAVFTVTKSSDWPTVAQAGKVITHCLRYSCTTIDAAVAAGDIISARHVVEGFNWMTVAQRPCAIRFWHKHTKTGTHCVALRNSVPDRSLVMEYTQDVSDAWEEAVIDLPASPSAGTWDYATGVGAYLDFVLMAGTTFHTTPGVWQTGNPVATVNQVNNADNVVNNFKIADVQLFDGTSAGSTRPRTAAEELALCRRYYEVWDSGASSNVAFAIGYCGTNLQYFPMPMKVKKRVAPTVTGTSLATFIAGTLTAVTPTYDQITTDTVRGNASSTSTQGQAALLIGNSTTAAKVEFSSEL